MNRSILWRIGVGLCAAIPALAGPARGEERQPPAAAPSPSVAAATPGGGGELCLSAIGEAERSARLPAKLLGAIGLVESGRPDPATGRAAPWPWTINVAGTGHFFATKSEAIAAVEAARIAGIRSIDVGCMQINLLHHPGAFATLDQAFDPAVNAVYAAGFLTRLFGQTGNWTRAAAAYHSSTPGIGEEYASRVGVAWGLAPRSGLSRGMAAGTAAPSIDPNNVYTPEFRARLRQDAADRAARQTAMRPADGPLGNRLAGRPGAVRPAMARLASATRSAPAVW